jgi:hypothetical protein
VRIIRDFLLSLEVMVRHSVLDFVTRSCLGFDWPAGGEDCNLEAPVQLRRRPGMYRAKTVLVWGFYNSVLGRVLRRTGRLSSNCFGDTSMIRCGDRRTGRGCLLPVFRSVLFVC